MTTNTMPVPAAQENLENQIAAYEATMNPKRKGCFGTLIAAPKTHPVCAMCDDSRECLNELDNPRVAQLEALDRTAKEDTLAQDVAEELNELAGLQASKARKTEVAEEPGLAVTEAELAEAIAEPAPKAPRKPRTPKAPTVVEAVTPATTVEGINREALKCKGRTDNVKAINWDILLAAIISERMDTYRKVRDAVLASTTWPNGPATAYNYTNQILDGLKAQGAVLAWDKTSVTWAF